MELVRDVVFIVGALPCFSDVKKFLFNYSVIIKLVHYSCIQAFVDQAPCGM